MSDTAPEEGAQSGTAPEEGAQSSTAPEEGAVTETVTDEASAVESGDAAPEAAVAEPAVKKSSRVRKWFADNRRILAAAAVAAFVAAGAFAGAAVQPYLMDRATVATKLKIARTAAAAIDTLWSYTP